MAKYSIFKINRYENKKPLYVFSPASWSGLAVSLQLNTDMCESIQPLTFRQFIKEWLKYEMSSR